MFEAMYGSTVEEEELFVNIDSGANRIIIKRIYLFDQLDRMRKSALRTANGQASLQVEGIGMIDKFNDVKICPRGLNGSNFRLETESKWLKDQFWR